MISGPTRDSASVRRTFSETEAGIPAEVFARQERQRLQPLPAGEWETVTYAVRKVGKTCHVVFGKNYYSVPYVVE